MQQNAATSLKLYEWLVVSSFDAGLVGSVLWEYKAGNATVLTALLIAVSILLLGNFVILVSFQKQYRTHGIARSPIIRRTPILLCLLSLATIAMALRFITPNNDYLKLALSNKPLNEISPERTRLVVELIRTRAANSQDNDELLADARKHPINPPLYTAQSFTSAEVMTKTVSRLSEFVTADQSYYDKQQKAMDHFRQQMATTDADFLQNWNEKEQDQENAEAKAEALQHEWLVSVQTLYSFVSLHIADFSIQNSKLIFHDQALATSFQELANHSRQLYQEFMSEEQLLVARQKEAKSRLQ